ncbi:MAG: hypothetical protein UT63_C0033G0011 [Candidatus Gottesmanbacteria bacterium GW2011_GWC2_39_8]|uniref:Uncharacterized protein n=1 Tax=Candidatus Gottesmanbacteria bacterium GW2011_GWC2_39_8 TaxID=1618450 RepID=A0A0G0Q5Z5_9BACT|nr:MAG: hypothetical protein UT63_C0033G0011 [Candidatus Gottesmanbacteria bacterium GW2011_GWC2_39_8]
MKTNQKPSLIYSFVRLMLLIALIASVVVAVLNFRDQPTLFFAMWDSWTLMVGGLWNHFPLARLAIAGVTTTLAFFWRIFRLEQRAPYTMTWRWTLTKIVVVVATVLLAIYAALELKDNWDLFSFWFKGVHWNLPIEFAKAFTAGTIGIIIAIVAAVGLIIGDFLTSAFHFMVWKTQKRGYN